MLARKSVCRLAGRVCVMATVLLLAGRSGAQLVAFPGAEGFGAYAMGGRGGDVYHVTNLNESGAGSLRDGVNTASGPRTIVFDVAGTINLNGSLSFKKSYMTIAGQTAPGDGITIIGQGAGVAAAHDVVVRYMRFRLGDIDKADQDAFGVGASSYVMIDHVSASWGIDETLSVGNSSNVTVQWSVISEGLRNSYHSEEPNVYQAHSMGSLLRYGSGGLTFHHNLFAHNNSRNPRIGDDLDVDWVNNVIYNGKGSTGGNSEGVPQINYVGNYIIRGPVGSSRAFDGGGSNTQIYQSGNTYDGDLDAVRDGTDTGWGMFGGSYTKMTTRFDFPLTAIETADQAYQNVLDKVGASLARDSVDARIVNDVINCTGGLIDSQEQVGGYPVVAFTQRPADFDKDLDGMADEWELRWGLDPNNYEDRNGDIIGDGYTNLEKYLNWLAGTPVPEPSSLALVALGAAAILRRKTNRRPAGAETTGQPVNQLTS